MILLTMTDPVKKVKNASQDAEAKAQTSKDHAEGKPSSETSSLLVHYLGIMP